MVRYNDIGDSEIPRLLREDRELGITLVLERFGGRIQGYLRQRFPSLDEGQLHDVVTDALLALADSFDEQRGSLAAWFLLLAHQQAIQRLRRRQLNLAAGEAAETGELVDAREDPLANLEAMERWQQLQRAIAELPRLERAVVEADIEAAGTVEAKGLAHELGTTRDAIYAARRRARKRLVERCEWVGDWWLGRKRLE